MESYLVGVEFQFGMMEKFWKWTAVMIDQECECT